MPSLFLLESPIYQGAGATVTYSIQFPWATTCATPTIAAYKGGTTVTTTVFPSGSASASGNTITLAPLTALTGGEAYIISIVDAVDGVTDQWFLEVRAVSSTTGKWH